MFGSLFKFGADTSQFSKAVMTMPRDVAKARGMINGQVQGMNSAFSALGRRLVALTATFGGMYAVVNSFKAALDMGGRLNDLASATGESAGNLSILERAFANAGVGAERVGATISKVQKFVGDLGRGLPTAKDAAKALGVSFEELSGKTPLEQMRLLASGLNRIQDAGVAADASMLVFGTRAGGKVTTLLKNFEGEVSNAREELGSLPAILDKTNQSLDELGDKLTNSIGNKLNEFAVGALAGAQGANDLANALSKVDAAGAGLTVGNLARFVATNPLKALEALGNTLLSVGADIANEIAAQVMAAFKGLVNVIVSGDFWSGVGNVVQGSLLKAASAFQFAIVDAIATALEAAGRIPVAGKMFKGLGSAAREEANQAAEAYRAAGEQMRKGMSQAGGAVSQASQGIYQRRDLFGEAYYAGRAVSNFEGAAGTGGSAAQGAQATATAPIKTAASGVASKLKQIEAIYAEEISAINASSSSLPEQTKARIKLDAQYLEAKRVAFGRMTNEAAKPEAARKTGQASSSPGAAGEATQMATETTLQKAVEFLKELTGKLPQPVLV